MIETHVVEQLSLFDDLLTSPAEVLAEKTILRGSGFVGGKQRIFEFVRSNPSTAELAVHLKREYGIGGWASPVRDPNSVHEEWHDNNGIRFKGTDGDGNELEGTLTWVEVALIVARLVRSGEYI